MTHARRTTTQHPLHPLARHGALRAALRLPGPDAEHPAARRPGRALPQGVLRRADLLGQPRVAADRPVLPQQRHARPRPPRLGAERLRPAPRPPAARGRLPLGADRRAAHLRDPDGDRLRRGPRGRHQPRQRGRPDRHRQRSATRPSAFFMSVGFFETHRDFAVPTSVRDTLYSLPPANLPDTRAPAPTWPRSRPAPARSTRGSAPS